MALSCDFQVYINSIKKINWYTYLCLSFFSRFCVSYITHHLLLLSHIFFLDSLRLELNDLDYKFLGYKEHCHFKLFYEQQKPMLRW